MNSVHCVHFANERDGSLGESLQLFLYIFIFYIYFLYFYIFYIYFLFYICFILFIFIIFYIYFIYFILFFFLVLPCYSAIYYIRIILSAFIIFYFHVLRVSMCHIYVSRISRIDGKVSETWRQSTRAKCREPESRSLSFLQLAEVWKLIEPTILKCLPEKLASGSNGG